MDLNDLRQCSQPTSTRRAGMAARGSSPPQQTVTVGRLFASTVLYGRDCSILCCSSPKAANVGHCCGCWRAGSDFRPAFTMPVQASSSIEPQSAQMSLLDRDVPLDAVPWRLEGCSPAHF